MKHLHYNICKQWRPVLWKLSTRRLSKSITKIPKVSIRESTIERDNDQSLASDGTISNKTRNTALWWPIWYNRDRINAPCPVLKLSISLLWYNEISARISIELNRYLPVDDISRFIYPAKGQLNFLFGLVSKFFRKATCGRESYFSSIAAGRLRSKAGRHAAPLMVE